MIDIITNIIIPIATLVAGGGWFLTYKAYKKKADGEADQSIAEGWKAQQDVYQQTIDDMRATCDYIKNDRDMLREENKVLRQENEEFREKYNNLEKKIIELQGEFEKQERKIEMLTPFICQFTQTCPKRKSVNFTDDKEQEK